MKDNTWKIISDFFEDSPDLYAGEVAYSEIDEKSANYNVTLPSDYREFIHRYGGALLGAFPIYGIGSCSLMGNDTNSVFDVTDHFRKGGWDGVENWLVISMDHAGNPVGLNKSGEVWISDSVHGCIDHLADSFEEYVLEWCMDYED